MTDQIAYETLPIGQPGTWVVDQRRRLAVEMDKLQAENRLLKQMLVNHWRQTQSTGAYLIQQGQDMERSAAAMADHLAELGVAVGVNVFEVGQEGM